MLTIPFNRVEKEKIAFMQRFFTQGSGYMREQATKPQTLGYGLADSPVGMLAWVYEKLMDWSEGYPWTDDEGARRLSLCSLSDR